MASRLYKIFLPIPIVGATLGCSKIPLEAIRASSVDMFSIIAKNYCPTDGFRVKEVFAFNSSAVVEGQGLLPDFDRDGLSDSFETNPTHIRDYNIHPKRADTNSDGYQDHTTVMVLGFDAANQSRLPFCPVPTQDTDRDGLTDCEESAIRTDYTNPDSDGDGVPDGLETRRALNPMDSVDALTDLDQDGWTALEEIKRNTPHTFTNDSGLNGRAYHYALHHLRNGTGEECMNVQVQNIPFVLVTNGNMVELQVLESKIVQGQGEVFRLARTRVLLPNLTLETSTVSFEGIRDVVIDARTGLPFP